MADDDAPKKPNHTFSSVNYPNVSIVGKDKDDKPVYGQLYQLYETKLVADAPNGVICRPVADGLSAAQVSAYIKEHEFDA